jgi:hypothetical protein
MEKEYKQVQLGVDEILGTKTLIRRKRKSVLDKKRELFFNVIVMMEELFVRQNLVYADLNLDFSNYDEKFFTIIDMLLYMNFGKQCMELIAFYLYDRVNADGTINALIINDDEELFLNNPTDLWNLMCKVNPKIDEQNI